MDSNAAKKDLGGLMDERLDMIEQHVLPAQKARDVLGTIKSRVGSRRQGDSAPCPAQVKPHLQ